MLMGSARVGTPMKNLRIHLPIFREGELPPRLRCKKVGEKCISPREGENRLITPEFDAAAIAARNQSVRLIKNFYPSKLTTPWLLIIRSRFVSRDAPKGPHNANRQLRPAVA